MSKSPRRALLLVFLLAAILLILLLLVRCERPQPEAVVVETPPAAPAAPSPSPAAEPTPGEPLPAEVLTPATVQAPAEVRAGATFSVAWTGPNNSGDYLTIVRAGSPDGTYANYTETRFGTPLELTAPIETGEWELRYVATRSRTVLARAPLSVTAAGATLDAPAEAVLGTTIDVAWTGPADRGDYITIVPKDLPDGRYGNYTDTSKGSPLTLVVPPEAGDAEIRYMTGQGAKVLARRPIEILTPDVTISAPAETIAGAIVLVTWTGPNNRGDYLTLVPKHTPDGQYGNYTDVSRGAPLNLTAPMELGDAEIRYMTGQGAKVLARRPIRIVAATVTLDAPATIVAGAAVPIEWTGPNNTGDYLTIVPKSARDSEVARSTYTTRGSPLTVEAPIEPGEAEIRYMSGQGRKVLARRALTLTAPEITLKAPASAPAGSTIAIEWTGPNNAGDFLTIVLKNEKDGVSRRQAATRNGSPTRLPAPTEPGAYEIRYMSPQGNKVLARADLQLTGGE